MCAIIATGCFELKGNKFKKNFIFYLPLIFSFGDFGEIDNFHAIWSLVERFLIANHTLSTYFLIEYRTCILLFSFVSFAVVFWCCSVRQI